MSPMHIMFLQTLLLLVVAPAMLTLADAVAQQRFATIAKDIAEGYQRIVGLFTMRERGSWVTSAAPAVALALALVAAAAVPTLVTATPAGEYIDLLTLGFIVSAVLTLAAAARAEKSRLIALASPIGFGVAILLAALALLLLGYSGNLDSLMSPDDMTRSAWLVLPLATFILVGGELLRRPVQLIGGTLAMFELAYGVMAAALVIFAARFAFDAPIISGMLDGGEIAASVLVTAGIGLVAAALCGALRLAFARLKVTHAQDRLVIIISFGILSVISAIVANFV